MPKSTLVVSERRCWVYTVYDPVLKKTIYVGKSFSLRARWQQHNLKTSQCVLLREYIQSKPYKMEFSVISVGGLDKGFPASRANEFEQYFISKYKTMHDPVDRRNVCNQKPADHVSRLEDGWFERVTAELDAGFQWPEVVPVEPLDAMGGEILAVRRQEAMMADLAAKLPGVRQVEEAYSEAVTARKRVDPDHDSLVFAVDSPFARARELKEQYEEMAPHALVDRNVVDGQLTSIGQYSLGNKKNDDEVEGMLRLWHRTVNPDITRLQGKPLTAGYAAGLFNLAYQWCGEHEEALLLAQAGIDADTDEEPSFVNGKSSAAAIKRKHILQALQWRKWSEAHDGRQPKQKARGRIAHSEHAEETTMADTMGSWRNGNGWVARRNQSMYLLLLRHHDWFPPFVRGQKASGGGTPQQTAKNVNYYLQLGFGTRSMVEAGLADRVIPKVCGTCAGQSAVWQGLHNFIDGAYADFADAFLVVGGEFNEARSKAVRAIHVGNIPKQKEKEKVGSARRKAAFEAARGARPSKAPKTEAGPSTQPVAPVVAA